MHISVKIPVCNGEKVREQHPLVGLKKRNSAA